MFSPLFERVLSDFVNRLLSARSDFLILSLLLTALNSSKFNIVISVCPTNPQFEIVSSSVQLCIKGCFFPAWNPGIPAPC